MDLKRKKYLGCIRVKLTQISNKLPSIPFSRLNFELNPQDLFKPEEEKMKKTHIHCIIIVRYSNVYFGVRFHLYNY